LVGGKVVNDSLAANLEGLRLCLGCLAQTIGALFKLRHLAGKGTLRDHLIDEVGALDSVQAMMTTVPLAMARGSEQLQQGHQASTRYG
jgi:hypothetical protein